MTENTLFDIHREDVTEYVEWLVDQATIGDILGWLKTRYPNPANPEELNKELEADARSIRDALKRAHVTVQVARVFRMTVQYVLPEEDGLVDSGIGDFVMEMVLENADSIVSIKHVATPHVWGHDQAGRPLDMTGLTGFEMTVVYRMFADRSAVIEADCDDIVSNLNGSLIYIKTEPHNEDGGEQ